jgi:hypothetical protein
MKQLKESTAAETAHALGLEYGGFGGWIDSNRKVVARTVNGKLVKVSEDEDAQAEEDLGRIIIFDFDDEMLYTDLKNRTEAQKVVQLLKSLVGTGSDIVILHSRNSEKKVAKFLGQVGISSGPTLMPIGSSEPTKKREFVEKKMKSGYSEIHFFDRDEKSIHAVESLKAPYNKLEVKIETHSIPRLKYDPDTRKKEEK